MMVSKIITHAASVVAQNKKDRVRVLSRVIRSKSKRHSPPASFQAAPPTCSLHYWRGGLGQRRVIVLKVMSHTFGKTITDYYLATEMFSPSQKKSWNW